MNLGRYQLMGRLATGGMAELFLAKAAGPMGFEKKLVVKRILPHLAEDESFIEMFFAEARLVARLDHPNIVQIFDFGEADGSYFIAMEYIDGLNLRALIKRVHAAGQRLPVALCAKVVSMACEGLTYAHRFVEPESGKPLHLVHRDISPDNLLVSTSGAVKLADFGIAKAANQMHRTRAGVVKGKVAYMPPEQLQGKALDARTDLFALGVVFYEMICGRKPFEAESETALMLAILHEEPVPMPRYRGDVPERVQRVIARALSKDPDARYSNCREMQRELELYLRTCDEPVGPEDIAQWVTRFSSPEAVEAGKTPNAKLLMQTPPAPSLVAPRSQPASSPPSESTRTQLESAPETEVVALSGQPIDSGDFARTASGQRSSTSVSSGRGRRAGVAGVGVLVSLLAFGGYSLWKRHPADSAPVDTAPAVVGTPSPEAPKKLESKREVEPQQVASTTPPEPQPSPAPPAEVSPVVGQPSAVSPPPSPELAFFRVESSVAGLVRVGGKALGRTPVSVKDFPLGRVSVEVSDKQQVFSKRRTIELKPGDNGVLRFVIGTVKLAFVIRPSAQVYLDDKYLGVTPFAPVEVYEGTHAIRLVNEKLGVHKVDELTVKVGDDQAYIVDLGAKR